MVPCSATMSRTLLLHCFLVVASPLLPLLLVTPAGAITVSIDRSDPKAMVPTRSSMIANGWRPLGATGYEDTIGTNVSPSSNLERNSPPLHPVLGKLQEHMAASEKLKPNRKNKPAATSTGQEFLNPPSILGSFTVFGHAATKARTQQKSPSPQQQQQQQQLKHSATETQEYTFLVPPPKDVFRFELEHHQHHHQRKPIVRQPQYVAHQSLDPIRAAAYYVKGFLHGDSAASAQQQQHVSSSSSSASSSSAASQKNRTPFLSYAMPQTLQLPSRQPAKHFESLKIDSAKQTYPQRTPASESSSPGHHEFPGNNKEKRPSPISYERYESQHTAQFPSSAGTGNFYSQVNHPRPSYKTSYERDPAFLVHESHEVSYVTPSSVFSAFNFRPSSPYDTLVPPQIYSSASPSPAASPSPSPPASTAATTSPRDHQQGSEDALRNDQQDFNGGPGGPYKHNSAFPTVPGTYYVSEQQELPWQQPAKTSLKYTSDINEVLPRVNPPSKFQAEVPPPVAGRPNRLNQSPKIVYVTPGQQQTHYQSSILPLQELRPQTDEPEYETPESISLKHFNEQQFLLQQQLIQRDRQRLAEQERQQQLEIERRQKEELKKRQQEIQLLIRQQKEKEERERQEQEQEQEQLRLQQQQQQQEEEERRKLKEANRFKVANANLSNLTAQQAERIVPTSPQVPYTVHLAQYEIPKVTSEDPYATEPPRVHHHHQHLLHQHQHHHHHHQVSQQEVQSPQTLENSEGQLEQLSPTPEQPVEIRPYRPPAKSAAAAAASAARDQYRRKKPTTVSYDLAETEVSTEVPDIALPQTIPLEETPVRTTPAPEPISPSTVSLPRPRTRRPGVPLRRRRPITTTEEPVTVDSGADQDFLKYNRPEDENSKRKRIKPTYANYEESTTEKRPNIRKRPGQRIRVNPGEPFDAEIVTEIVHTYANPYRESVETQKFAVENEESTTTATVSQPFAEGHFVIDYGSSPKATDERHPEDTSEISKLEFYTEADGDKGRQQQQQQQQQPPDQLSSNENPFRPHQTNRDTNIPLEELFGKAEGNYVSSTTTGGPTSTSGSGSSSTPNPAVVVSTTFQSESKSPSTSPSTLTLKPQKIRPMRFGNATRPRFSIKDYKSRMDYKNRIAQMSTTDASAPATASTAAKQRLSGGKGQQGQPQLGGDSQRETTGRYKYVSRVNYRSSTPSPSTSTDRFEDAANPAERINRFVPKRKPVNGNVYRSRISGNTASFNRSQQIDGEIYSKQQQQQQQQSTARPENVFSSSIRRRPTMKKVVNPQRETEQKVQFATEMAAEETSFYSAMTTAASTASAEANEIGVAESPEATSSSAGSSDSLSFLEKPVAEGTNTELLSDKSVSEKPLEDSTKDKAEVDESPTNGVAVQQQQQEIESQPEVKDPVEQTTRFHVKSDEEELFAKASQSVADLTSSASALYDKPGMFKAVSPESRVVSSHFKINTDEPTLPIEAFFQELSKKN